MVRKEIDSDEVPDLYCADAMEREKTESNWEAKGPGGAEKPEEELNG